MSSELNEQLSRLLAGDLPPAEADALRQRIRTEPEVAARHEQMSALLRELPGLDDPPPPPNLNERVARALLAPEAPVAEPPADQGRVWWPVVALAAVALLMVGLWPDPQPTFTLVEGRQHLEGDALVLAPGARIEVNGEAVVSVEPQTPPPRSPGQEEFMNKSTLLAAAAGSAITVVVLQGSAMIWPDAPDAEPVEVQAGETHTVNKAPARKVEVRRPEVAAPDRLDPEVASYIEDLEKQVATLQFENSLVHGQLETHRGSESPWPEEVSPVVSPDGFTAAIEDVIAGHPDLSLDVIDCAEYPCIAKISAAGTEDLLRGHVEELNASLKEAMPEDDVGLMLSAGITKDSDDPDAPSDLVLHVAAMEEGEAQAPGDESPVQTRLAHRMREMDAQ